MRGGSVEGVFASVPPPVDERKQDNSSRKESGVKDGRIRHINVPIGVERGESFTIVVIMVPNSAMDIPLVLFP